MGYGAIDGGAATAAYNFSADAAALVVKKAAMLNSNPTSRCRECGDEIGHPRLSVIPNAAHCVPCQQEYDKLNDR